VRFTAECQDGTRVEPEPRLLDWYWEPRDEVRGILGSEGGWSGLLASVARAAAA
jgi:hypothetical protein